jgi:hypothetical protein
MEEYKKLIIDIYKDSTETEDFRYRVYGILQEFAINKDIKIDGYFQEKFNHDSITNFPEDYFSNPRRIRLYVFCAALCNNEIFELLKYSKSLIPFTPIFTRETACSEIIQMGNSGMSFM